MRATSPGERLCRFTTAKMVDAPMMILLNISRRASNHLKHTQKPCLKHLKKSVLKPSKTFFLKYTKDHFKHFKNPVSNHLKVNVTKL